MDETLPGGQEPAALTAGDRLRGAREALGLSLADIAARTRVSLRQLEAIEQGRYGALPSPTYVIGFAKAYARAVGVDEVGVAAAVRGEIARVGPRAVEYVPYELPDPARVPSRGLAILGVGAAVAVLILLALWYGTNRFRAGSPAPVAEPTQAATSTLVPASPVATPTSGPTAGASSGKVTLTANDEVWLRVYDADNKTLYLGVMKPGEHFDVPANAKDPMINVGRPDKLAVSIDGKPVPPLGRGDHAIKDVKVDGAAIAARLAGAGAPPEPTPSASSTPGDDEPSESRKARQETRAKKRKPALTETQRANLDAAAVPPASIGNALR